MTAAGFITSLEAALGQMQARSRLQFCDKTILDGLAAIVGEGKDAPDFIEPGAVAATAAAYAIERFRDQPGAIGRARLSDSQGVDLDDPGMAFLASAVATVALPV
jgi:hypothetical protein